MTPKPPFESAQYLGELPREEGTTMIEVISLGGGIQSTTLVLMNLVGEIKPRATCAIFADTGWERQATYNALDWLEAYATEKGFPIYRISSGDIRADMVSDEKQHFDHIPLFTDSGGERAGQLRRQCTNFYKIAPIRRKM